MIMIPLKDCLLPGLSPWRGFIQGVQRLNWVLSTDSLLKRPGDKSGGYVDGNVYAICILGRDLCSVV